MTNKGNSNQVKILVVIGVIGFTESTNWRTRIIYLLLVRPVTKLQIQLAK